jgi:hypothetical protein
LYGDAVAVQARSIIAEWNGPRAAPRMTPYALSSSI